MKLNEKRISVPVIMMIAPNSRARKEGKERGEL